MQKNKLEKLASERNKPCVTISMNTARTQPDNMLDAIALKKLLTEARGRVVSEFGKRQATSLLEKIDSVDKDIDLNYSLESLHIFLSNSTNEIIKSLWSVPQDSVQIAESFAVKPLIIAINRTEEHLILVLSQSGVHLYHAINDGIAEEIVNEDFPLAKNPHYSTDHEKLSESKTADNLVREFLNTVDKAVVKVHNKTGMNCIIFCTEDNYSRLMQVADKPLLYMGHVRINYDDISKKTLTADAWQMVNVLQKQSRLDAMNEMQEAAGQGKVITDLVEMYRAVKEGRGDLLMAHDEYRQAVKLTGDFSFDLVDDVTTAGAIDDIINIMARDVVAKKGRSIFTGKDETRSPDSIALKLRY